MQYKAVLLADASKHDHVKGTLTLGISVYVGDWYVYGSTLYECILAHTAGAGNYPPNTTYWKPVVSAGTPLGSVSWKGAWSSGTTYAAGDGCTLSGHAYVSIVGSNLNHSPPNVTYWVEVYYSVAAGNVVGPASSTASDLAEFDGATGLLLKDGALTHANVADAITKKHVAVMRSYVMVGFDATCDYVCDGTADEVQINQATSFCNSSATIKEVRLQNGVYNLAAAVIAYENVHIIGSGHAIGLRRDMANTAAVLTVSTQISAISAYRGSWIDNLAFYYPSQQTNAAPTSYPATIILTNDGNAPNDCMISKCLFVNSYIGVNALVAHERLRVLNCAGWPLYIGIEIDLSTDIDYIKDNHFNPNYYSGNGSTLVAWMESNAIGIKSGQADGAQIVGNFLWGYLWAIYTTGNIQWIIGNGGEGTNGLYMSATQHNRVIGNYFDGQDSAVATQIQIQITGGGVDNVVEGNTVFSNQYGIVITSGSRNIISNNEVGLVGGSNAKCIYIAAGTYNTISTNICNGGNMAGTIGIAMEAGCNETNIINNIVYNTSASGWGIYVANGSDYYIVTGNNCHTVGNGNSYGNGAHIIAAAGNNLLG
jgi:parallel beta-helix repeat protein